MTYGTVNADVIGTSVAGSNLGAGNASTMKNRIINGSMTVDQRNSGASVTVPNTGSSGNVWGVDRFVQYATQASKFSVQQNAGSVTPPVGFSNYLGHTSLSAYSVTSSDYFFTAQKIEGFNTADLQWGTANAKTVTLSFWAYSSLTGTFGGSILNSAINYSYPFSYSIPVANTWTQISVTIAGPTAGTWIGATNGTGMWVVFSLGAGSTASGTAGSWSANQYFSATGATSVVGTSGATFYITGVQLEVGSSATGFEYRQYGTELQLCQRYFEILGASASANNAYCVNAIISTTQTSGLIYFQVPKRTTPTITASGAWYCLPQSLTTNPTFVVSNIYNTAISQAGTSLTVGQASYIYDGGIGTSRISISAEL